MSSLEKFKSLESYTFEEGIAFLVLVKAPLGVINHLKATHNRSHLHSEIHKQLRFPRVKEIVRKNFEIPKASADVSTIARNPDSTKKEESPSIESTIARNPDSTDEEDESEIILNKDDIRTHANTRLEDMPNDLCRTLWQKRQDVYREMQQAHLKMRAVPEGEEHNEERAKWRAEVLRLDAENDAYWRQIDEEIARVKAIPPLKGGQGDSKQSSSFDLSTYRAYISKALRKKKLSPEQLVELQHRVDAMIAAKVDMKPETLEKLKAIGINVD